MSTDLLEKIARLEADLARLRELETNPPELPEGFVVAEVANTDCSALKHADYLPDEWETAFVVVPKELGEVVWLRAESSGMYATAEGGFGGHRWWAGFSQPWGYLPEEAILRFLADPGHWVE